jgi:hypothetical protein
MTETDVYASNWRSILSEFEWAGLAATSAYECSKVARMQGVHGID